MVGAEGRIGLGGSAIRQAKRPGGPSVDPLGGVHARRQRRGNSLKREQISRRDREDRSDEAEA
jgi:hypothetical protein